MDEPNKTSIVCSHIRIWLGYKTKTAMPVQNKNKTRSPTSLASICPPSAAAEENVSDNLKYLAVMSPQPK